MTNSSATEVESLIRVYMPVRLNLKCSPCLVKWDDHGWAWSSHCPQIIREHCRQPKTDNARIQPAVTTWHGHLLTVQCGLTRDCRAAEGARSPSMRLGVAGSGDRPISRRGAPGLGAEVPDLHRTNTRHSRDDDRHALEAVGIRPVPRVGL